MVEKFRPLVVRVAFNGRKGLGLWFGLRAYQKALQSPKLVLFVTLHVSK